MKPWRVALEFHKETHKIYLELKFYGFPGNNWYDGRRKPIFTGYGRTKPDESRVHWISPAIGVNFT